MMAAAGGESLDRGAKDDEKKKRPEVGDLLTCSSQLSSGMMISVMLTLT